MKPRIVEIRCPSQPAVRTMGTTVAPFPQVVHAMLLTLPPELLTAGDLGDLHARLVRDEADDVDWDAVQGAINRVLRRLDADATRAFFHRVDERVGSFSEPWTFDESRFIANAHGIRNTQHRRACRPPWKPGTANGTLLKRWPAEELDAPLTEVADECAPCARAG